MNSYEDRFENFYAQKWGHDKLVKSEDLLLDCYPYSIEISLPVGSRWLELGVGTGRVIDFHKEKLNNITVIGVDSSPSAIKHLKETLPVNIEAMVGDLKNLNFEKNSFDLITLFGTIQAVEKNKWISTIYELKKFLKQGGKIGFSVHPLSFLEILRCIKSPVDFKNIVTERYLRRELEKHGLKGKCLIEKHHAYTLLLKITSLFGIKSVNWYGFYEYPDTKINRYLTRIAKNFFPFLTFGHYWIWIKK